MRISTGCEQTGVERDGFAQEAAQAVDDRAGDDGGIGVEVAGMDRAAAGEVERGSAVVADGERQGDGRAVVERVAERADPGG